MNRTIAIAGALVVAAFVFVLIQQRAKTKLAEGRAADLEIAARSAEAQARANGEAVQRREIELRRAQAEAHESAARLAATGKSTIQPAATNRVEPDTKADGPLIKDAETRALMRKQQLQGIRKQVDRFVDTNLIARLSLSSQESGPFKDLLLKKHSGPAEFMAAMMAGELEGESMRQTGRQVKDQLAAAEQDIQQFLGPARYGTFLEEEKAQETRLRVSGLADELKKSQHAFSGTQRDQLLATMLEERRNFPFADGFGDPMRIDFENFYDHFSDANLDRYLAEVQAFNERVRERAAGFLGSEQIEQIRTAQQNHLEQARVTVKLTNALFAKRRAN